VLRFYRVYRALVRAKVHALRAAQEGICTTERERLITASRGYIDLAQRCARDRQPAIILMHGLSGAGKSMLAQALAEHTGAIRLRSDVERKRISDWALASGLYTADLERHLPSAARSRPAGRECRLCGDRRRNSTAGNTVRAPMWKRPSTKRAQHCARYCRHLQRLRNRQAKDYYHLKTNTYDNTSG
jgi:hypothetical protein